MGHTLWDSFYAANFNCYSDTSRMTTRCIYSISCYWLNCQWILCQLTNSNFCHTLSRHKCHIILWHSIVTCCLCCTPLINFMISDVCDIACIWHCAFTISKPLWTLVNVLCNVINENKLWKTKNGFKSIVFSGKSHQ